MLVLAAAFAVAGALPAHASAGIGAPAIWSDQPDYAPGATVTLNGDGWGIGEVVHINVNDSAGSTWSRDVDVTADFLGNVADQFVLPDWFVAMYTVTATGPSGTATTTFTDGNIRIASAPSGVTFTLTWQKFDALGCTGTVTDSGTELNVGSSGGARFTKGAGNTESIKWVAADLATAPAGRVFRLWTAHPADPFTANFGGDRHAICTNGFSGGGTRDYIANYNTAPSVTAPANQTANEGTAKSFSLGSFTDAQADSPWTVTVDWGDGSPDSTTTKFATGSLGTLTHVYDDGSNTHTVTVTVTGNGNGAGGASGSATFTVTVSNVAPTAAFPASRSVNEGTSSTFAFTSPNDFSNADTSAGFRYAYSCTGASLAGATYASSGTATSVTCAFDDGPSTPTVRARIIDKDNGFSEYTTAVTVNNVAPTATFPATQFVNEGSSLSFAFTSPFDPSSADTTAGFHYAFSCTGASLAGATYAGSGTATSVTCTFPDGPSTDTVLARIIDKDGGFTEYTTTVTVNNVAPQVSFTSAPSSVNEGSTHTYTYSISDPGVDTISSVTTSCGANGTKSNASNTNTSGTFDCTFPDGPAGSTVLVQVTDSDGATGTAAAGVSIANVAPTVALTGSSPVNEGSTHTYSYTTSDPGSEVFSRDAQSCDGGALSGATFNSATGAGSFDCTYADGPSSHNPSVTVSDGDGGSDSDSLAVTVNNVAPSIAISGAASVNEGSVYSLTLGAVSDPGTDTVSSYVVHWGDGSSDSYPSNGVKSHTYADGANDYAVTVDLVDEDGTFLDRANLFSVHVNNVAPSIAISGAASVNEGSAYSLTLGAVSDPGVDTVSSYVVHWGDGNSDTYSSNGAKSHTYADGDDDHAVTVDLVDEDGTFLDRANPFSVHVNNVAPSIAISGAASVNEGSSYSLTLGAVSDPGVDTVSSYVVHWGDGNSDTYSSNGAKSHTYADGDDDYAVTVDLVDEDGTFLDRANAFSVHVNNVAPTASLTGAANVEEGSTHTYTFTVTDPGVDTFTVDATYPKCGTGGTYVEDSLTTDADGGSFDCFFPDGPATTNVAIKVTDSDGASDTDSESVQIVQVANVAPTVTAAANQSADEGDSHSFSLGSFGDPGPDSPWDVSVDWGDGSPTTDFQVTGSGPAVAKSLGSKSHTYADGPNDYTVTVTVSDNHGDSDSATFSVHVNNVPPTVTLSGDQSVAEGSAHTYSYTTSDPGSEVFSRDAQSCDGGALSGATFNSATGAGSFDCTYADGPSSHNPSVTVSDGDGGSDSDSLTVTVNNVAPTVTLTGDQSVAEGSTHTYSFTTSDPGSEVFSRDAHDCDGGTLSNASFNSATGAGSFDCTYADGPSSHNPSVTVSDGDGGSDSDSLAVTVNNVAPTATFNNTGPVNEGSSFQLSLTDPQDPSSPDTSAGFTYAFDCGSGYGAFSTTSTATCPTNDSGTRTVKGKIKDRDNGVAEYTTTVTVNNVAPTATFSNDGPVNEGTSFHLSLTSPQDPSLADTTAGFTYAFDCGSGYGVFGSSNTATCPTTDNGTRNVKGKIRDKDGAVSEYTDTVTVKNVGPIVTINSPAFGQLFAKTATANPTVSVNASFTDAGTADTHTCSLFWDDSTPSTAGTVVEPVGSTPGTCSGSHTYTTPGVYTIRVTVNDDDGGSGYAETMIVVYDASAGFVTGGGWLMVDPGSYSADMEVGGRANFGFNAQYKKGATVPTGNTEFQFQVGNLNFHSQYYSWLVVSGFKAQFKGTGTLNGLAGYDFTLTAYDGNIGGTGQTGSDRFRIKITKDGSTVFDNRNGASMDMDAANPQNIAGGSIVIHKA